LFNRLRSVDVFSASKREEALQPEVSACGLTSLDAWFGSRNFRTREGYKIPTGLIPADRHGFDVAKNLPRLVKAIVPALDAKPAWPDNFPATLLKREAFVLTARAKRRRPLDFSFKESVPAAIQPVRDSLYRLGANQLPVLKASTAQLRQMLLQCVLLQILAKQFVVATVNSNRMIPNVRGNVNRPVQMLNPLRSH
jgi:hypothetical protein